MTATRNFRLVGCLLALLFMSPRPSEAEATTRTYSRDLGCGQFALARSQAICHELERSMEWTWLGHAIVSPGWRLSFAGVTKVFCRLAITAADVAALIPMTEWAGRIAPADWRLQNGAQWLVYLLGDKGLDQLTSDTIRRQVKLAISESTSIWNPENPAYPLRGGCAGAASRLLRTAR